MNRRSFFHYLAGVIASIGIPLENTAIAASCNDPRIGSLESSLPDINKSTGSAAMVGKPNERVIKVIGVGGAGANTVEHMIREGIRGIEFICINTDSAGLEKSSASIRLQIGPGFGVGGQPTKARDLALSQRNEIAELLNDADMVFITAGLGGGTGTGLAPVIAEVAHELGVPAVAVVSTPFDYEGRRNQIAAQGLSDLHKVVDSVFSFSNENLFDMMGDEVLMIDAFRTANRMITEFIAGHSAIINWPSLERKARFDEQRRIRYGKIFPQQNWRKPNPTGSATVLRFPDGLMV